MRYHPAVHHPLLTRVRARTVQFLAVLVCVLVCSACEATRKQADPTLLIESAGGRELGVGTEYGVVFLGQHARSGEVDVSAWFGDGPSTESSVVEPIGGGLYTAQTEIRLPAVPLSFAEPRPGSTLTIIGRTRGRTWRASARVLEHPAVEGLLLEIPSEMDDYPDQIGAGVFRIGTPADLDVELVGLVSGRLELQGESGPRAYLTVVGPRELWRLAAYRRDLLRKKRWVYREDIL
jgi:hypothetical protein